MSDTKPIKKLSLHRETIRTGLRAGRTPDAQLSAQADSMGNGGSGVIQAPVQVPAFSAFVPLPPYKGQPSMPSGKE